MKKIIICTIFFSSLSILNPLKAQSFSGLAKYNIKLAEDVFNFNGSLKFNNHKSLFIFKKNKKQRWFRDNEAEFKTQIIFTDSIGYEVLHNVKSSELIVRSFCEKAKPIIYKDTIQFKWKLDSNKKIIQGIACKKAHTTFRGREYEAWYAPSIPVSMGPWKFFGLPGLIVQITDKSGEVSMLLESIDIKKSKPKIIMIRMVGKEILRKQFNKCLDDVWTKYYMRNKSIIAKLQAEAPDIEITDGGISKTRNATEIEKIK